MQSWALLELSARGEQGYEIDGILNPRIKIIAVWKKKWVKNTVRDEETPVEKHRGRGEGESTQAVVLHACEYISVGLHMATWLATHWLQG